ncbi:MAG: DUF1080 domain-containing protein [Balneolaceae bacterium]
MKSSLFHFIILTAIIVVYSSSITGCTGSSEVSGDNWVELWDGETFNNWRASENPDSFSIEDGRIVVDGPRAHLFYEGPVADADFTNFEFRADVYTYPNANSGIFFHTQYQEDGWPEHGYEAQVNATHSDPRKTGSLYAVEDVMDNAPHEDEEWFTYHITVDGSEITFRIDGEVVMQFTEPDDREGTVRLGSGTFALQAHDPESRVYYRNIEARVLPD